MTLARNQHQLNLSGRLEGALEYWGVHTGLLEDTPARGRGVGLDDL